MPPLPGQVPFHLSKQLSAWGCGAPRFLRVTGLPPPRRPSPKPQGCPAESVNLTAQRPRHATCATKSVMPDALRILSRSLSSLHLSPLGKWIQSLIRTGGAQKGNTTTRAHTHTRARLHTVSLPNLQP